MKTKFTHRLRGTGALEIIRFYKSDSTVTELHNAKGQTNFGWKSRLYLGPNQKCTKKLDSAQCGSVLATAATPPSIERCHKSFRFFLKKHLDSAAIPLLLGSIVNSSAHKHHLIQSMDFFLFCISLPPLFTRRADRSAVAADQFQLAEAKYE